MISRAPFLLVLGLTACATETGSGANDRGATAESSASMQSPTQALPAASSPVTGVSPSAAPTAPASVSAPTPQSTLAPAPSPSAPRPLGSGGTPTLEPEPGASAAAGAAQGGAGGLPGVGGAGGAAGHPMAPTAGAPALGGAGAADAGVGGVGGAANAPYNPCPPAGEPCRVVPFGDSITDGYNVPGGYRMELFHLALEAGQSIEFAGSSTNGPPMVDGVPFPQNHEGHSGYTIEDAPQVGRSGILPLVDTVLGFEPDIILLKIGTNDLDNDVDVENAPQRLGSLLDDIFSKDDHVLVVVAQIIPSRDARLNELVATYNDAVAAQVDTRREAGKHVLLADMESAFLADPNYRTSLLADGLHPNESGYALLGQTWYGVVGELFR